MATLELAYDDDRAVVDLKDPFFPTIVAAALVVSEGRTGAKRRMILSSSTSATVAKDTVRIFPDEKSLLAALHQLLTENGPGTLLHGVKDVYMCDPNDLKILFRKFATLYSKSPAPRKQIRNYLFVFEDPDPLAERPKPGIEAARHPVIRKYFSGLTIDRLGDVSRNLGLLRRPIPDDLLRFFEPHSAALHHAELGMEILERLTVCPQ